VNNFEELHMVVCVPVGGRFQRPGVFLFDRERKQVVEEDVLPVLRGVHGCEKLAAIAVGDGVLRVSGESLLLFLRQIEKLQGELVHLLRQRRWKSVVDNL
jgi:hypothetical protein